MDLSPSAGDGAVVFATNFTMDESSTDTPVMLMTVLYIPAIDDNCLADVVVEQCSVTTAQAKYSLIIRNDTITLDQAKLLGLEMASIHTSPGDLLNTSRGTEVGPLKGLGNVLDDLFFSNATMTFQTSTNTSFYGGPGTLPDLFYEGQKQSRRSENCTLLEVVQSDRLSFKGRS